MAEVAPALPDFAGASAEAILAWAFREYAGGIVVATSLEDTVLVDLAHKIDPAVPIFFLLTRFHFEQTLETLAAVEARYGVQLVKLEPVENPRVWSEDGYSACCEDRKVLPMNNYLEGKRAWVTGIRRVDAPTRAGANAVEWDAVRGLVKINPLVEWSDQQLAGYIEQHQLVVNPLKEQGYGSIGCAPCTIPGSGRAGRWAGDAKVECGLHTPLPVTVVNAPGA
ncbi:MAG: phosphoadenylyl-sulfate reductase [Actinomycetota bacterium]